MQSNRSIESLYLEWCGFRDEGSTFIATVLESNTTLKVLDISGNNVGFQTCVELDCVLRKNTSLQVTIQSLFIFKTFQRLGLRNNPLTWYGARILLKSVASGISSILKKLKRSRSLRSYRFERMQFCQNACQSTSDGIQ